MKTKTKTVEKTVYICDNCGAEHNKSFSVYEDFFGNEVCDKCSEQVPLYDNFMSIHDRIDDVGTQKFTVKSDMVLASELDLELDREDYASRYIQVRKLYKDLCFKLAQEYLKGKVRDFQVKNFVKTYFGL